MFKWYLSELDWLNFHLQICFFISGKNVDRIDTPHLKSESHRQLMALRNHPAYIGLKLLYRQKSLDKDELALLAGVCVEDITLIERIRKTDSLRGIDCACIKLDFVDYF